MSSDSNFKSDNEFTELQFEKENILSGANKSMSEFACNKNIEVIANNTLPNELSISNGVNKESGVSSILSNSDESKNAKCLCYIATDAENISKHFDKVVSVVANNSNALHLDEFSTSDISKNVKDSYDFKCNAEHMSVVIELENEYVSEDVNVILKENTSSIGNNSININSFELSTAQLTSLCPKYNFNNDVFSADVSYDTIHEPSDKNHKESKSNGRKNISEIVLLDEDTKLIIGKDKNIKSNVNDLDYVGIISDNSNNIETAVSISCWDDNKNNEECNNNYSKLQISYEKAMEDKICPGKNLDKVSLLLTTNDKYEKIDKSADNYSEESLMYYNEPSTENSLKLERPQKKEFILPYYDHSKPTLDNFYKESQKKFSDFFVEKENRRNIILKQLGSILKLFDGVNLNCDEKEFLKSLVDAASELFQGIYRWYKHLNWEDYFKKNSVSAPDVRLENDEILVLKSTTCSYYANLKRYVLCVKDENKFFSLLEKVLNTFIRFMNSQKKKHVNIMQLIFKNIKDFSKTRPTKPVLDCDCNWCDYGDDIVLELPQKDPPLKVFQNLLSKQVRQSLQSSSDFFSSINVKKDDISLKSNLIISNDFSNTSGSKRHLLKNLLKKEIDDKKEKAFKETKSIYKLEEDYASGEDMEEHEIEMLSPNALSTSEKNEGNHKSYPDKAAVLKFDEISNDSSNSCSLDNSYQDSIKADTALELNEDISDYSDISEYRNISPTPFTYIKNLVEHKDNEDDDVVSHKKKVKTKAIIYSSDEEFVENISENKEFPSVVGEKNFLSEMKPSLNHSSTTDCQIKSESLSVEKELEETKGVNQLNYACDEDMEKVKIDVLSSNKYILSTEKGEVNHKFYSDKETTLKLNESSYVSNNSFSHDNYCKDPATVLELNDNNSKFSDLSEYHDTFPICPFMKNLLENKNNDNDKEVNHQNNIKNKVIFSSDEEFEENISEKEKFLVDNKMNSLPEARPTLNPYDTTCEINPEGINGSAILSDNYAEGSAEHADSEILSYDESGRFLSKSDSSLGWNLLSQDLSEENYSASEKNNLKQNIRRCVSNNIIINQTVNQQDFLTPHILPSEFGINTQDMPLSTSDPVRYESQDLRIFSDDFEESMNPSYEGRSGFKPEDLNYEKCSDFLSDDGILSNPEFLKKYEENSMKEFIDDEAELSGEDNGLDDDEEYDDNSDDEYIVHEDHHPTTEEINSITRLHAKQVKDDDDNMLNYLKEQLLEDGDLNSDSSRRSKLFAWKNIEVDKDDSVLKQSDTDEENIEENFVNQEKAKWLQSNKVEKGEDEINSDFNKVTIRKMNIVNKPRLVKGIDEFQKSKQIKRPRGSFLHTDYAPSNEIMKKVKLNEDEKGSKTTRHFVFLNGEEKVESSNKQHSIQMPNPVNLDIYESPVSSIFKHF